MSATLVETIAECRSALKPIRLAERHIGFVPTMGALHEGHLSLVDRAREVADIVVVSIFVNPTQFGPTEDFEAYPRDLDRDLRLLGDHGVDLVFVPAGNEMYRTPPLTRVIVDQATRTLEGRARPSHFDGVLLVVSKLLNVVQPDVVIFGQKDAQQAAVVKRMIADLNFPVEVVISPTIRETDGLACSSRNAYLSEDERNQAVAISRALQAAADLYRGGEVSAARIEATMMAELGRSQGVRVEYAAVVDAELFQPVESIAGPCVAAIAARVGETRLIDNISLGGP